MSFDVVVAKKVGDFALDVAFQSGQEPLAILGPSGAGKSMLLRCIAGLESVDSGRIVLNDRILFDNKKSIDVPARDRHVGLLFQHYALFPHRNVRENIAFGLRGLSAEEQARRVRLLIERVHVTGLEQRFSSQLSGGEQQRVALARALAIEPEALLLDEPLSALDTHLRSRIERELQEIFATYKRPSLLVTHNIEEAYRLGQNLLVLSHGRVAAFGPKEEILHQPPSLEVAQLTGCKNISRARPVSEGLIEATDWGCYLHIAGMVPDPLSYVGIRAHQLEFVEPSKMAASGSPLDNIFSCSLAQRSETPFRMTLYLRLADTAGPAHHLQAEVSKERWQDFQKHTFPWHVRLSPDHLFLMPR